MFDPDNYWTRGNRAAIERERANRVNRTAEAEVVTVVVAEPSTEWTPWLGDIGADLGISGVIVGKLLDQVDLRKHKYPTAYALGQEIARRRFTGFGDEIEWDRVRTAAAIKHLCPKDAHGNR